MSDRESHQASIDASNQIVDSDLADLIRLSGLIPEPGPRPGRTRHAMRDPNPVQGQLRSYLCFTAQGHAKMPSL